MEARCPEARRRPAGQMEYDAKRDLQPMFRLLRRLLALVGLLALLWFGAHAYAAHRVRTAFAEAGMNERAADCMGTRLTRKLSLWQLRKLEALQEERRTVGGLLRAVRRIDDARVVKVTTTSMLLCQAGIAR